MLHNPVTLPVVCQRMLLRSLYGGQGRHSQRTMTLGRIAGIGAECGFPAAELLPVLVVAGRDQGGIPRPRQHRRALRTARCVAPRSKSGPPSVVSREILRQADHAARLHPVQRVPARPFRLPVLFGQRRPYLRSHCSAQQGRPDPLGKNVVVACSPCNLRKSHCIRLWHVSKAAPRWHQLHRGGYSRWSDFHDSWLDYLYGSTELDL